MEFTISFLSPEKIVLIETSGVADEASSLEMAKNIRSKMIKYKTSRCMIDHTNLKSVSGKTVEIYDRPRKFLGIQIPIKVKIAEVVLPEHKEFFRFLETVSRNRGFRFQIFENREAAIAWLME